MAQRLKPVDVVTIGVGLTGSLAALELAKTGLKVVGLERGAPRFTVPDFQSPAIHDELRFSIRKAMMQDNVKVPVTFRNTSDGAALPIRRPGRAARRLFRFSILYLFLLFAALLIERALTATPWQI